MKKSEVNTLITDITGYKYSLSITNQFKKSFVLCVDRGLNKQLLVDAVVILAKEGKLPPKYKVHPLKAYQKKGDDEVMECHIQPDWLLIWKQNDMKLTLLLTDTGTHADLFGM